jgi:hypothetical protein
MDSREDMLTMETHRFCDIARKKKAKRKWTGMMGEELPF